MEALQENAKTRRDFQLLSTLTTVLDRKGNERVKPLRDVKIVIKQPLPWRKSSVGTLDSFPLEVQQEICHYLDFRGLAMFVKTSFAGKEIIESLTVFTHITSYACHFLKAISKLGLLHLHSLATIAQVLKSTSCHVCGTYGSYFFPLTGSRCCFFCLTTKVEFSLVCKAQAAKWFGSSSTRGLPSLFTEKSSLKVWCRGCPEMVECFSARMIIDRCQSRYGTSQYYNSPRAQSKIPPDLKFWTPDQDAGTTYAATVIIPYVQPKPFDFYSYSEGRYCRGCSAKYRLGEKSLRAENPRAEVDAMQRTLNESMKMPVYTAEEMLEHLKTCSKAARYREACLCASAR